MLIQVDGIEVNFEERGSGWPILMLHGGYLDHRHMMDEMEPAFQDRAGWHRVYSLRLYDTRGTAATRLLNHGLTLKEIAQHMGWSLRTASNMIEKYARVSPDETDTILHKLTAAKRNGP